MSVLTKSAGQGLVLVLVILALFLEFKLAMWMAIGIPVALMGAIAVLPATDINISTLTVMGFILVLRIVVDDAIVVGSDISLSRWVKVASRPPLTVPGKSVHQ